MYFSMNDLSKQTTNCAGKKKKRSLIDDDAEIIRLV